jgi:sulfur relay (sulfurtransferase) DsrF/TusC family protein
LAFQVPLKVVFSEDGVLCLLKGQGKGALEMGDIGKAFAGLASMGLPQLMVVKEDLEGRKLCAGDLVEAPLMMINTCDLRRLIGETKLVIPF